MAYQLSLVVGKERSFLTLSRDSIEVSRREWPESRDMGRQLFAAIEELLTGEGIRPNDVTSFEVSSDLPDSSTSRRIAETVSRVYTFAVRLPDSNKG